MSEIKIISAQISTEDLRPPGSHLEMFCWYLRGDVQVILGICYHLKGFLRLAVWLNSYKSLFKLGHKIFMGLLNDHLHTCKSNNAQQRLSSVPASCAQERVPR